MLQDLFLFLCQFFSLLLKSLALQLNLFIFVLKSSELSF